MYIIEIKLQKKWIYCPKVVPRVTLYQYGLTEIQEELMTTEEQNDFSGILHYCKS